MKSQDEKFLKDRGINPTFGYFEVGEKFLRTKVEAIETLEAKEEGALWKVLNIQCGGYNGAIDEDILKVLSILNTEQTFVDDIAKQMSKDESYIELIQYLICSAELAEYGGSPRGCWLTDYGKFVTKKLSETIKEKDYV